MSEKLNPELTNNTFEIKLPEEFTQQMQQLLGKEYESLERALSQKRSLGLRVNPLKVDKHLLDLNKNLWGINAKVEWADEGYYYRDDFRPGKSPYHECGAYYLQEPSAMSVVQALDPKPGEVICDLCAAPGGKTTHIAGRMNGKGTLISNEIVPERSKILARNVERMGISNCMVTNEDPASMLAHFPAFFDKIVVDAPCSGEGMFRKEDAAIPEWSLSNVEMCAKRQADILDCASGMVKPGGSLVYSTCTFEPDEDERQICAFLDRHKDWDIVDTGLTGISTRGRNEWSDNNSYDMSLTTRIWPHINTGEGHFIAKLVRKGELTDSLYGKIKNADKGIIKKIIEFLHTELINSDIYGNEYAVDRFIINGEHVYLRPEFVSDIHCKGLRIVRGGLELVTINKNRFEPAHALAVSLRPQEAQNTCLLDINEAHKYLRGETINRTLECANGSWVLIVFDGLSMGWAKYVNGILKNHYPKGLRINY